MKVSRAPLRAADGNASASASITDFLTKPENSSKPNTSKRPHSALEASLDSDGEILITDNCDVVRRKITALLNSGEMKVTEFLRTIDVNSNSYGRFMKLKGPTSGSMNQTYEAAFRFFQKRKTSGVREVPRKRAKKADMSKKLDVSGVHLNGEEADAVPIYDTCDDVRRKIAAYLRDADVTQAGFLREIGNMFSEPKKLQSKLLKDFQAKKGPLAGNTSSVYYGSYVFFEKLRLRDGKPKTKKRLETEDAWACEGGIDRKRQGMYLCSVGHVIVEDEFGRARSVPG